MAAGGSLGSALSSPAPAFPTLRTAWRGASLAAEGTWYLLLQGHHLLLREETATAHQSKGPSHPSQAPGRSSPPRQGHTWLHAHLLLNTLFSFHTGLSALALHKLLVTRLLSEEVEGGPD